MKKTNRDVWLVIAAFLLAGFLIIWDLKNTESVKRNFENGRSYEVR